MTPSDTATLTAAANKNAAPTFPKFMAEATCLPANAFTDPDIYKREMEGCFRKGWVSIGIVQQVPKSGDMLALDVVGEPLLITRDRQDQVRVFYNVCRHRGAKLVAEDVTHCATGIINCPYHMWGYGLDGRLAATPYWNGAEGASAPADQKERLGLLPVRSAVWAGIIFVNLSGDAQPFDDFIRPLAERWKCFDLSLLRDTLRQDYTVKSNWKFVAENALDSYHLPWVHAQLGSPKELYGGLTFTYLSDNLFGLVMPDFDRPRDTAEVVPTLFPALVPPFDYALDLIYMFPNTVLLATPSWFQLITFSPRGPGLTQELLVGYLVGDEMMTDGWAEYRAFFAQLLREVNEQDMSSLARMQLGRATAAADQCQYVSYWDQLTEYLAQAVKRAMA